VLERTWIQGKTITVVYFLTPESLSRIIYGMKPSVYVEKSAEFLAWLHSLKKSVNHENFKELQQRYVTEMKVIVDQCFKNRLIDSNIANKIVSEINKTSRYDTWGPMSLIHGDFKTQNILVDGKKIAIIDFESLRYDFSYLDLSRFIYNIKVRTNKYPYAMEHRINCFISMFLKHYEMLCGKINRRALASCYLQALLTELKSVLSTYSLTARSFKMVMSNFLIRRGFNYIVKEILVE
jgi:Ser/Thr protein kinase RdoA (MazF antagonist)